MANPYVRQERGGFNPNAYRMISPQPEPPPAPPTGRLGAIPESKRGIQRTQLVDDAWISKYGPVACEVFHREGFKIGADPNVYGDVTFNRRTFEAMFNGYESPGTQAVRDFAWNCYVEGFEQGRKSVGQGGGGERVDSSNDDGWSWGTWVLVLGGVGTLGLFGYNLWAQK